MVGEFVIVGLLVGKEVVGSLVGKVVGLCELVGALVSQFTQLAQFGNPHFSVHEIVRMKHQLLHSMVGEFVGILVGKYVGSLVGKFVGLLVGKYVGTDDCWQSQPWQSHA